MRKPKDELKSSRKIGKSLKDFAPVNKNQYRALLPLKIEKNFEREITQTKEEEVSIPDAWPDEEYVKVIIINKYL